MQQKRDKTRSQSAADDAHRGIPRDAKGDPIFLILPPVMRARYDKQMAQCESAWRKGELLAVAEAAVRSQLYRQPIPAWLADAIVELAVKLPVCGVQVVVPIVNGAPADNATVVAPTVTRGTEPTT